MDKKLKPYDKNVNSKAIFEQLVNIQGDPNLDKIMDLLLTLVSQEKTGFFS